VIAVQVPPEIIVIGAITGLTYAILAAGLVLVFRTSRVINFAHGELGALGGALFGKLVLDWHTNWGVALFVAVLFGAALGAAIELLVVRRLAEAPRLMLLVATIALAQLLFFAQISIIKIHNASSLPTPINRMLTIGGLILRGPQFMVIALVPAACIGLAVLLTRTPYGVAIRAGADNPDAARLAGIRVQRFSTVVWALAGALAVVTAVLVSPLRGTIAGLTATAVGPGLLQRALAAGLLGRMESLPVAMVGGVGLGVAEALVFVNVANPAVVDLLVFVLILALLLLRPPATGRRDELLEMGGTTPNWPDAAGALWRRIRPIALGLVLVAALAAPFLWSSNFQLFLLARTLLFVIIALSVTVVVGFAGQLSLGQFAFVGVGAMITGALVDHGMPFGAAVVYATAAGVVAAIVLGIPSLRVRGLSLAVATLAFAVAARQWLFTQPWLLGHRTSMFVPRGRVGPFDLHDERTFYMLCLAATVASVLATRQLRNSGVGRRWIAVRDNEDAAAAYGISPSRARISAFAVAAALAAFAGALFAGLRVQFGPDLFGPDESLRAVAMTVIGGLGSVPGAVAGALYVIGTPAIFSDSLAVRLLTSGAGLLALVLFLPGGLVRLAQSIGARVLSRFAPEQPDETLDERAGPTALTFGHSGTRAATGTEKVAAIAVQTESLTVRFGGIYALEDVSIRVAVGETVGFIGANGAGKSTLLNVLSGLQSPSEGRVLLDGEDVTDWAPPQRAAAGLGRLFQDARLFPGLSVTESLKIALESHAPSELLPSMLALPPSRRAEAAKEERALEIVTLFGLQRYADTPVAALSTGLRRIVEFACLYALGARTLLLDEPTAGVAQRETEAFVPVIRQVRDELAATVVIVEHDMPLMMALCDRIYCLGAGRVIAEGTPESIRQNPAVIEAYLGTDDRAILRSSNAG
jgi:ABC-type branched-subunit amino acid transport system ATPase component/ABC-type branched-subunit amino acid transport system permease subunit